MDLTTRVPCSTRTQAQHELLAGIIGIAPENINTEAGGLIGRCRVQAAIVTDGGNVTASYLVESNSDPGLYYALARTDKGNIFCPCKGYEMRGKCSHMSSCDEAPAPVAHVNNRHPLDPPAGLRWCEVSDYYDPYASVVPDFQPFRVGDPVVYTSPRDGATVSGQVAAVAGERVTISTASGAYRNYPIAHITPWQPRTVEREATRLEDTAAYQDLFGEAA
jgi:hypothetical protein